MLVSLIILLKFKNAIQIQISLRCRTLKAIALELLCNYHWNTLATSNKNLKIEIVSSFESVDDRLNSGLEFLQ